MTSRLLYYLLEILHIQLLCIYKLAEAIRSILSAFALSDALQLTREKSGETQSSVKTNYLAMIKKWL